MVCEKCAANGMKSKVYIQEGYAVAGWAYRRERFYDEEGKAHVHDEEPDVQHYKCTNGHTFHVSRLRQCPCHGCSWNDQQLEAVRYDSLPEEPGKQPTSLAAEKTGET